MKFCLAPMDGITDAAFRLITAQIFDRYNDNTQNELYLFTEFMSADWYIHNPKAVVKHILDTENEKKLIFQIFGNKEKYLIDTAIDLQKKYNPFGIELNIGCPSPKVVAHGSGSGMLKDKVSTLEIIKKLRQVVNTKFSIKTRTWLNTSDRAEQFDFVLQASKYCDFISLHGRTFKQWHSGDVDWQFIYDLKSSIITDCQIFGNWWIKTYDDIAARLGNLDGIMIGQASIGNPWIFTSHTPDLYEKWETIIQHLDMMIAFEIWFKTQSFENNILNMPGLEDLHEIIRSYDTLDNEIKNSLKSSIEFRKHIFSYIKWIPETHKFKEKIIKITDYIILKEEIRRFFDIAV